MTQEELPVYRAPALEKGLDILECLSSSADGMSQAQVAASLHRSSSEIFRMLEVLMRRGYIRRDAEGDRYVLTPRLFALGHQHPPTKRLLDAALPEMRSLAEDTGHSCHLAVQYQFSVMIVAQVESPLPMGYAVRLGSRHPILETGSGRILLAFQPPDILERWKQSAREHGVSKAQLASLPAQLEAIRQRGHEKKASSAIQGITDLSAPILDHADTAIAALTIPYLSSRDSTLSLNDTLQNLKQTAARVSTLLGG